MLLETLSILSIFLGGYFLIRSTNFRGWSLVPLGFISGVYLLILLGGLYAISGFNTNPIILHTLTLVIPLIIWIVFVIKGRDVMVNWGELFIALVCLSGMIYFFRFANLVKWSPDTFRYLMIGNLFANGNFDYVTPSLLNTRLLSVSLINSAANLQGEYYFPSVLPLLSISTGCLIAWYLITGSRKPIKKSNVIILVMLILLLLFSNNRYIYNSFYINGHLLFAIAILILCGNNWLFIQNSEISRNTLLIMQLLSISAIIITRPDGSILAGITLIPMVFSKSFPIPYKRIILITFGSSVFLWQGYLVWVFIQQSYTVPISVSGLLSLGVLSFLIAFFIKIYPFEKHSNFFMWISEISLWLALLGFAIIKPNVLIQSLEATKANIIDGKGGWGTSIIALGLLVIFGLILTNFSGKTFLRFSITTFLPVSFVLAYLREGAYRVGLGDSLNRSFFHIVPLSILFISVSINTGQWNFKEIFNKIAQFKKGAKFTKIMTLKD